MLGEGHVGLAHPKGGDCLIIEFRRYNSGLAQLLGAGKVLPRLLRLRLRKIEPGLCGMHLRKHFIDGLLRACKLRSGLLDANLEVAGIERHQHIAALYGPVVLDVNRRHGSQTRVDTSATVPST